MKSTVASAVSIPDGSEIIEVRVSELRQLFNAIDPSPFGDRDLDPNAAEFIVRWARETRRDQPLALLVHLDRPEGAADERTPLEKAVRAFFANRALSSRGRLRELLGRGRISLVIGLAFLATSTLLASLVGRWLDGSSLAGIAREGFSIGGWVAMWRPLEVFLYDWWPIHAEARLFDRLATMPVAIQYGNAGAPDAWRNDWPASSGMR
jgi:hypothetical protein